MRLSTPRFGEVEVKEEDIIVFPAGILGFDGVHRYVLLEHNDGGLFHILQGVDDPAVAFVLIDPRTFRPDYKVEVAPEQVAALELDEEDDAVVMAIVTVPEDDPAGMTANLQAPLVFNARKRLGCQVVMPDGPYGIRHSILAELQAAAGNDTQAVVGDTEAAVGDTEADKEVAVNDATAGVSDTKADVLEGEDGRGTTVGSGTGADALGAEPGARNDASAAAGAAAGDERARVSGDREAAG